MTNLKKAVSSFIHDADARKGLCDILTYTIQNDVSRFESLFAITGEDIYDILLELWEWKLILPMRSSKCGEWDSRILVTEPGETFQMPNISKYLVRHAIQTGEWNTNRAIIDLFQSMNEPDWASIPDLVLEMKNACVYQTITGTRIGAACVHNGLKGKTGAMIAVLKGAGIISPKLMNPARTMQATSPLYEFNPCVYPD